VILVFNNRKIRVTRFSILFFKTYCSFK